MTVSEGHSNYTNSANNVSYARHLAVCIQFSLLTLVSRR